MDIGKRIYVYIVETFEIEEDDDFNADINLFDYGYVDSLDAMTIISWLETTFEIEVTPRDLILFPMNTINELADMVKGKMGD